MRIELLYFDGCPSYERLLPRLRELVADAGVTDEVELRRVDSPESAVAERFLGSPTVRVDGIDVERAASARDDFGLKCRLYSTAEGLLGTPPDQWITGALNATRRTSDAHRDLA
jgi:hypothetical protein